MMASAAGGMDIEEVADEDAREDLHASYIEPGVGLVPFQARQLGVRASASTAPQVEQVRQADRRRSTRRSSPPTRRCSRSIRSIVTADGDLLALDAKMNFDDNALYRHPDINELRDLGEEDPLEVEASKFSSTTSTSTATSAAWSTAPAWRWRRWTSSSWRRRAGELPRRRRRRQRRADPERVQDPDVGQEREGGADQHLRRHPALRRARRRA